MVPWGFLMMLGLGASAAEAGGSHDRSNGRQLTVRVDFAAGLVNIGSETAD
ncbi:MAG: hypothetical protein ACYTG0_14650 [Planctomycetota bacterium]|jgi:hypothetical protein